MRARAGSVYSGAVILAVIPSREDLDRDHGRSADLTSALPLARHNSRARQAALDLPGQPNLQMRGPSARCANLGMTTALQRSHELRHAKSDCGARADRSNSVPAN